MLAALVVLTAVSVHADTALDNGLGAACKEKYHPDIDLTVPQIIRRHGYPSESHVVVTDDGYLLTLHRVPHGKEGGRGAGRPVVFLQHGLLSSSSDWVLHGPGKSLAYILADAGYDVWMSNVRGNTYSKAHVTWSTEDSRFWNFTWNEMALHDLPASMDHILELTGQSTLFYIGHSMGTTLFFVLASSLPEYNAKVRGMFALAPVVYMEHIQSPIRLIAPWAKDIQFLAHFLGEDAFLPQNKILRFMSKYGCDAFDVEEEICSNVIFILCGFDKAQFDMSLLPVLLSHTPAGTSTRTLVHYAQEISSGKFQKYDFGTKENLVHYNSTVPPVYNLSAVTAPVALYYADNDWLASEKDVSQLAEQLNNKMGTFLVDLKGFNHLDFLWGIDAKSLVYDHVMQLMRKLTMQNDEMY